MKIDHLGLYVSDLETAKDFFIKYFGARAGEKYYNPRKEFKSYFLSFDDGARIEIMTRPDADGYKALGGCHISMSIGSKIAVNELTLRLKADGYDVVDGPRTTGDGYYESCIIGIDGNLIEIMADS